MNVRVGLYKLITKPVVFYRVSGPVSVTIYGVETKMIFLGHD